MLDCMAQLKTMCARTGMLHEKQSRVCLTTIQSLSILHGTVRNTCDVKTSPELADKSDQRNVWFPSFCNKDKEAHIILFQETSYTDIVNASN